MRSPVRTCRKSTSCSRRCGLPYKEQFVDVWKGEQYSPDFIKINPNSKIPAIVDHEGPGGKPYTVIEFGRDPALPRREDRQVPAQGHGEEIRRDPVADDPAHRRRADVRAVDALQAVRAQDRQRLCDGALHHRSEAPLRGAGEAAWPRRPISAATNIRSPTSRPSRGRATTTRKGVKWEDNPNLARWFKAIEERPAVKAALAKVGAIKSNRDTASDDQKDRFFNRGRYARA